MAPAAGGATALAGAGSIGNYKGVMLCNRPFAGVAAAAKGGGEGGGAAAGKHAFVTGKVKSEVGFAGKSLQTEKLLRKRVKHETALTRHRKWLVDLQLTKQALEEQYMEDLRKKEESKKRFAQREARMRQMTREHGAGAEGKSDGSHNNGRTEHGGKAWAIGLDDNKDSEGTTSRCYLPGVEDTEHDGRGGATKEGDVRSQPEEEEEVGSRIDPAELRAVEKRRKRDGKPCRPMWAMTEAKAQVEDELKHEEELEVSHLVLLSSNHSSLTLSFCLEILGEIVVYATAVSWFTIFSYFPWLPGWANENGVACVRTVPANLVGVKSSAFAPGHQTTIGTQ